MFIQLPAGRSLSDTSDSEGSYESSYGVDGGGGGGGSHWEFAHTCYLVDDAATCIDPIVKGYTPPADFSSPPSTGAFGGATRDEDFPNNCTRLAAELYPSLGSCDDLKELLCHDERLAGRDCGAAFVEALEGTLDCSAPRCEKTMRKCHCKGSWSFAYEGTTYTGLGCANPDGDPRGEWCPIVPGSCRGIGTSFGLPTDQTEDFYDYCGVGVGSSYSVGWSAAELARVAGTLADVNQVRRRLPILKTAGVPAAKTRHAARCPRAALLIS